jgi:hypothetical protein
VIKRTRCALLNTPLPGPEHQQQQMTKLRKVRHMLFRVCLHKEELRELCRLPSRDGPPPTLHTLLAALADPASRRRRCVSAQARRASHQHRMV